MRFTRIKVDGFKQLGELDWSPEAGLNLILGPNEAGKSSLAQFIDAMIFGLPGGAAGDIYRPWSGGKFGGRLEMECGRVRVAIEREFSSGDFHYEETDLDGSVTEKPLNGQLRRGSGGALANRYHELLTRHMGFFDDKLFRRSTYIPQAELTFASRELGAATTALRSLASGGGSTYDRALELLDDRYYSLTSEGDRRRKPGVLDILREEKTELSATLRESSLKTRQIADARQAERQIAEELEQLKDDSQAASQVAEIARELTELGRRRAAQSSAESSYRERLADAEEAAHKAQDLGKRLQDSTDLATTGSDFPELVSRARSAHERVERMGDESVSLKRSMPPAYPHLRNASIALAGTICGSSIAAFGAMTGRLWALIAGAAAGLAGILAVIMVFHFRKRSVALAAGQADSVRRTEVELGKAREELQEVSAEMMDQTGGRVDFSPGAMDQLLKRYSGRLELMARREALEDRLLDDEELEELRRKSRDAIQEMAILDQRIEKLDADLGPGHTADNLPVQSLATKAEEARRTVARREQELHERQLQLAGLTSTGAQTAAQEERLEDLNEVIPRHESRCRALSLARSELAASLQEFQEGHLERISGLAADLIEDITGGRYTRLELDSDTLEPSLSGEKSAPIIEESLSQGTRAALFLALRFAMAKLIAGGRSLPLILDDPLVDLDDQRRQAAMSIIAEIAGDTQVMLMSFDRRLAEDGIPVLELEDGTRRSKGGGDS